MTAKPRSNAQTAVGLSGLIFMVAICFILGAHADPDAPGRTGNATDAGEYMDQLLGKYDVQSYKKNSNTVVVYVFFERTDLVKLALPALLNNTGLKECDLIISQDGGSSEMADMPVDLSGTPHVHLRHPVNLMPGQHHTLIKRFVFDVLGYEDLIIVEEDNILHPEAINMLRGMLTLSKNTPAVGIVGINDLDNSMFINETRLNSGCLNVHIEVGHLWVYAMTANHYQAVKPTLMEYLNIIKSQDYRSIGEPPLRDRLVALLQSKGMPTNIPLSQDAFLVHSLAKAGYTRRLTTLLRLYRPVGWHGFHFQRSENEFFNLFGRDMYEGPITGAPFVVEVNTADMHELRTVFTQRMHRLYKHFLGRPTEPGSLKEYLSALAANRLNGIEVFHAVLASDEHLHIVKGHLANGFPGER